MRVALISHNARTGDAIGNQVAARAAFFRERGAQVTVLVECDRRLQASLRALVRVVGTGEDLAALAGELRGCDLVVVDYGQYYRLLEVLPLVGGSGPRVLFDYHGVTPPELWDGPAEALREGQRRRGLVWYADQAVVHSRFMRDELCAATGYPPERVHVMPLWFEAPTPARHDGDALRRRLGLRDERVLLFVGRLAANKRVPVLVEALALLKDERPAVHLAIIGDDGDVYRRQLERCRELADGHEVAERVHFLGHVSDAVLAEAYRGADVFVMPSRHEGCCIPVLEAMAAGLPVVAARAAALPETIAGAGLSFAPDDAADLARQVRRVLGEEPLPRPLPEAGRGDDKCEFATTLLSVREYQSPLPASGRGRGRGSSRRIAVIAPRYGEGVVGGAERSLRLIAETLAQQGHRVEVFTTGRGAETLNGVYVHRFAPDPVDEAALAAAQQALRPGAVVAVAVLHDYFRQTRGSGQLLDAYRERSAEFDACVVGPYGNGLTWEALQVRPERTLLAPYFHREPLAQQPALAVVFAQAGGLLYHSAAERRLAEEELGIHHPNASVIGTWLAAGRGDAGRGRRLVGADGPYLVYAGRYCREKNLPLLLDWMRAYGAERPGRFQLVLTGDQSSPHAPRAAAAARGACGLHTNLGFLSEADKAGVLAGAAALVQLSANESLSLVALEAWNEGTPVIGHAECDVLGEMITESGAGEVVGDYEQFRAALDDLWDDAGAWRQRGRSGHEFVRRQFGSREEFAGRLAEGLAGLDRPLAELMSERGLEVLSERTGAGWERAFAERVESVLNAEPVVPRVAVRVEPRTGPELRVRRGSRRVAVRLTNAGTVPLWAERPQVARLRCRVLAAGGEVIGEAATPILQPLNPGQSLLLPVRLPEVGRAGEYLAEFHVAAGGCAAEPIRVPLRVSRSRRGRADDSLLADVGPQLARAEALAELPAGYEDVSEGALARWKHALKRKLLRQFQVGYVDVLSRQQTEFNRQVLAALQELAECTALLGREDAAPPADLESAVQRLKEQARRTARRLEALERRLEALESSTPVGEAAELDER